MFIQARPLKAGSLFSAFAFVALLVGGQSGWAVVGGLPLPDGWIGESRVVRLTNTGLDLVAANCSFTIVGERHLLTAGHCVDTLKPRDVVGSQGQNSSHVGRHQIQKIVRHPQYRIGWDNSGPELKVKLAYTDIALVRFEDKIEYPKAITEIARKDLGVVSGILITSGKDETGRTGNVRRVQYLIEPYILRDSNGREFRPGLFIGKVADPKSKASVCPSDSGSELVVQQNGRYEILGVLSSAQSDTRTSVECGAPDTFPVFVPVVDNLEWLLPELTGPNA